MNHLKLLEFQRLIKELQFVEADYLYQSEILSIADGEFFKSIENILSEFPTLREIYYSKKDKIYKSAVESFVDSPITESVIIEESLESKKLYRDIVKTTHPDKIKNHRLNELYLEATEAYSKNDIITLYKVCSELNIEFELPDSYISEIKDKIQEFKNNILFLENTYTSKWLKTDSQSEKNKILVSFISGGIN